MGDRYRDLSLWFDQLPAPIEARPALRGPLDVDVAIVGAGYTGLWTAYYLHERDPSLRIAILEAEVAGFGASGRNGGWCSALYPVSIGTLAREVGRDAAIAQYAALRGAVGEVSRVATAEGVDADVARGGMVSLARSEPQLERARRQVAEAHEYGLGLDLLDAATAGDQVAATRVMGATFTPHCAALHPAKLVRGLADVVTSRGVRVYERTAVRDIAPHAVRTHQGTVRAEVVVRATEGYTAQLPHTRRAVAPVYSLMIATAPLAEAVWADIGLARRETFTDYRHLIIYGQRTADDRLAFGGRGAPYHAGSRVRPAYDRSARVHRSLHETLVALFPVLRDVRITHRWGGPLGISRDWHPSVGLDAATGFAWAGGYVGDGVATSNLAGRTLADLICGRRTELTALPWVGHHSRRWEPEPLRWLGVNAALQAMTWADHAEARTGRASRLANAVDAIMHR
jgi:glycine/D-amino acid oxidase-like deaminating enzyme